MYVVPIVASTTDTVTLPLPAESKLPAEVPVMVAGTLIPGGVSSTVTSVSSHLANDRPTFDAVNSTVSTALGFIGTAVQVATSPGGVTEHVGGPEKSPIGPVTVIEVQGKLSEEGSLIGSWPSVAPTTPTYPGGEAVPGSKAAGKG